MSRKSSWPSMGGESTDGVVAEGSDEDGVPREVPPVTVRDGVGDAVLLGEPWARRRAAAPLLRVLLEPSVVGVEDSPGKSRASSLSLCSC